MLKLLEPILHRLTFAKKQFFLYKHSLKQRMLYSRGCLCFSTLWAKKYVYNISVLTPDAFKKFSLLLKEKNLMSVKILQISILGVVTITV